MAKCLPTLYRPGSSTQICNQPSKPPAAPIHLGVLLEGLEHLPAPGTVAPVAGQAPHVPKGLEGLGAQQVEARPHLHALGGGEGDVLRGQACGADSSRAHRERVCRQVAVGLGWAVLASSGMLVARGRLGWATAEMLAV
jgi:hypothetical protein